MNSDSLAGLHVLVTRPIAHAKALREAIESHAGRVLSLPLIDIQPLEAASDIQSLTAKVQQLDRYQILIFVSSNAAKFGAESINNYWPQFPIGVSMVATGPATAEALRVFLGGDIIQPVLGVTSEDLLKLPLLEDVAGKKIAIVRGKGGRELMAATLQARGAQVDYLEAYRRVPVEYDGASFCAQLRQSGVDVLSVTSGESLHRLQTLLADNKGEMSLLPLLVPSERVGLQARECGFTNVVNSNGADTESILRALKSLAVSTD